MNCEECGTPIPVIRLRALPNATTCLNCAVDERIVGLMVWEGKTAPALEIGTPLARASAGRRHTRFGPHIRFEQKEGMYGCARRMEGERTLRELGERLWRERRGEPEPDADLEPIIVESRRSRCHPDRPRAVPSGLCLPCALAVQRGRIA